MNKDEWFVVDDNIRIAKICFTESKDDVILGTEWIPRNLCPSSPANDSNILAHPPSSPKSSGHSCVLAVGLFCVYFAGYLKTIFEWLNVHKAWCERTFNGIWNQNSCPYFIISPDFHTSFCEFKWVIVRYLLILRPVMCHAFCVILTHFSPKTHIHTCIEQFLSFDMHSPISKQIFEIEFENQKKIRFPNEYYIVHPYRPARFVDVILVSFVLQTKVMGFGHSLFYILDLGSVFYWKCTKIESAFQIFSSWFIVYACHEREIKNIWESV